MKKGQQEKLSELFSALEIKQKESEDKIGELAAAREKHYDGGQTPDSLRLLNTLDAEAISLGKELEALIQEAQQVAEIPEELLEAMEQAVSAPDEIERIKRSSLAAERMPPTDNIEDTLSKHIGHLLSMVEPAWLTEEKLIAHRFDEQFLKSPNSLIKGVRVKSEFPSIHRFAQILSICEDFLVGNETFDFYAAALAIPQAAGLGYRWPLLDQIDGETLKRKNKLWKGVSNEVESTIFELLVAASCVAKGRAMEFISETSSISPDLRVHDYPFPTFVECKRKRVLSDYEIREELKMQSLFQILHTSATQKGIWGTFILNLSVETNQIPVSDVVEKLLQQPFARDRAEGTLYAWGSVSYKELPSIVSLPPTKLYSPNFLKHLFGWDSDIPMHDGIICQVSPPDHIMVDSAREPIALAWNNKSPAAIHRRSWSPIDLFGGALKQVPAGGVGIIYLGYHEGAREEIADSRVDNYNERIAEWHHSAGIRIPISFLIRLLPRVLGDGNPDLIENGMRYMSQLYGTPTFFADFPSTVITRLET